MTITRHIDVRDDISKPGNIIPDADPLQAIPQETIKDKMSRICSKQTLKKRLPILTWLPKYQLTWLWGDIVAGLSVALIIFPHSLAAGLIAGLGPTYGLYTSFMGGIVYFFLGPTKKLNIGSTYIMSLMTLYYSNIGGPQYAALLTFLVGIVELVMGFVNLGFLINFISVPVISGYTSGAGVTIISSQLKRLFGPKIKSDTFFEVWYQIYLNITNCKWEDLVLYVFCTAVLIFLKELRTMKWPYLKKGPKALRTFVSKFIFYLSEGRNVWIITFGIIMVLQMGLDTQPFSLTGTVPVGIPEPTLPSFSTTLNNSTMSFLDIFSDIGLGVFVIPFVAIIDQVLVARSYAEGGPVDLPQEIATLGIINILGSFFNACPSTASLHRTWANDTSGARTPVAGMVTGLFVLFVEIHIITHYVSLCPVSNSVGIITCGAYIMLDFDNPLPIWRSRKPDFALFIVTFSACLALGLEWGIVVGVGINICVMLISSAKPPVKVTTEEFPGTGYHYVRITPASGIHFSSSDHIIMAIKTAGLREAHGKLPVIVSCSSIHTIDYTSAKAIQKAADEFEKREQALIFVDILPNVVKAIKPLKEILICERMEDAEDYIFNHPCIINIQL